MKNSILTYVFLILLAFSLFGLELFLGSVDIPKKDVWSILFNGYHEIESWKIIVLNSRLPRAISASVAGVLLSLGGLLMQTLFKNPLAGPHILGVSAGSSLGVAIVIMGVSIFSLNIGFAANYVIIIAAFLGAMFVLALLFLISIRLKDVLTVLIFGVLISAVTYALIGILQYLSPEGQLKAFLIWTLGSFDGVDLSESLIMLISCIPFLFLLTFLLKPLNLLLLGEEQAATLGLNVKRNRFLIMLLTGAMTAVVTSYCGPIGFVGVVVPHFARVIFKSFDHRKLFISSLLIGINVMLFADLLAHLPGSDRILPVNSITAIIGIPFIFWILLRKKSLVAV